MTASDAAHAAPRVARRVKRGLDVLVSGAALIVLSPALAAIAVAVRCTMGPPVFFGQVRPGYRAQPFTLFKFRTMRPPGPVEPAVGLARLADDTRRLSRLGRLLRRTSLDELPQLWNVLRGDMSLVGPRPLLAQYLPRYTPEEARRHEVPPGLTGWAQVHGRKNLPMEERFVLDVWYVDHWSLRLDLAILTATVRCFLESREAPGEPIPDPWLEAAASAHAEAGSTSGPPAREAAATGSEES